MKQLEDLVDGEVTCRQYKFKDGNLYRVPVAKDNMDKIAYENLVEKYNKNKD